MGKFGGRTSGTRPKGSGMPATGAGWGGAPTGKEGNHAAGPGRPPGVRNGEGKVARARAALEDALPDLVPVVIAIAKDASDPRAVQAFNSIAAKVGLNDKQEIEHSGAVGAFALSDEERRARLAELLAKREAAGGSDG